MVAYSTYIISTQLGRAAGSGLIKGRKELGAEIGAPKTGKRQMTEGPTLPRFQRPRVRCVMVHVQWSTAKLTLSCQLKRNKQARGNESCRSIPSRRHIAARLSLPVHFRSHHSPVPSPS